MENGCTANSEPLADGCEDFEPAAKRSIEQHIHNSFVPIYRPVWDDARKRSFDSMEEYARWCK